MCCNENQHGGSVVSTKTLYTLTNYNQPVKISDKGSVNIDDNNQHGAYDYGTFEKNRYFLYSLIANNKINYTLSGHSHRSALYQVSEFNDSIASEYDDTGMEDSASITTKGIAAKNKVYTINNPGACKMIVSSCGGPIGIQNYNKELANWGLDNPSGSFIKFNAAGKDTDIGLKIPNKIIKAAKPRLAVALDYADIFGPELSRGVFKGKLGGVFKKFESTRDDGPFKLEINSRMKLPETKWIKDITQYEYKSVILLYNNKRE